MNPIRRQLTQKNCVQPASVFDVPSARLAQFTGHQLGVLGGSIASAVLLGAPDMTLLSSTELSALTRRICQQCGLGVLVDADHGFGTPLNVMRTVEDLQAAGAAGVTLEDSMLPRPFGAGPGHSVVGIDEMVAKIHAGIEARGDQETVLVARTDVLRTTDKNSESELHRRVLRYQEAGPDALMIVGLTSTAGLERLAQEVSLPLVLGTPVADLTNAEMADLGVRIVLRGHATFEASLRAVYLSLREQSQAGSSLPGEDAETEWSTILNAATSADSYAAATARHMN